MKNNTEKPKKFIYKMATHFVWAILIIIIWRSFFPDNFRAITRHFSSIVKSQDTKIDRASISNEADAATTYGVVLRDVYVLYLPVKLKNGKIGVGEARDHRLVKGAQVRLCDVKQKVLEVDGQGFIRIQLANENGSFVQARNYWVEAEFIQIVSPGEIISR